jgi:sugar lactone lactonase YvrE
VEQSSLSGHRKAQFTPVAAAILAIVFVGLGVMALSTLEALASDDSHLALGDPIPRIQCPPGYTATLYAQGLSSPDGLAFSPSGVLHVAEEMAGRISHIEPGGSITTVVSSLANPEGIAFDTDGNLYVVEDVQNGRLVQVTPDRDTTELATGLDWPEGIVWASEGTNYITESNLEFDPSNLQTRVTAVVSPSVTVLTTDNRDFALHGLRCGFDMLASICLWLLSPSC